MGVVVRYGKFRLVDLGDLTWNTANSLFCPINKVGPLDVFETKALRRSAGILQEAIHSVK